MIKGERQGERQKKRKTTMNRRIGMAKLYNNHWRKGLALFLNNLVLFSLFFASLAVNLLGKTAPILGTKNRHLIVNTTTRKRRKSINTSTRVTSTSTNATKEKIRKIRLKMVNLSKKSLKLQTNF